FPGGEFEVLGAGAEGIEDLVRAADEHGGRYKLVQQDPLGQLGEIDRRNAGGTVPGSPPLRQGRDRKIDVLRPTQTDAPVDAPLLGQRLEQIDLPADRLRGTQEQKASLFESQVK